MKRALPWFIAASAYIIPPFWAYFAMERNAVAQKAVYGFACGNPALGMMLLACIGSAILSLSATLFRGWAVGWWKTVSLGAAGVELVALALPFFAAVSFAAYLFLL